MFTLEPPPQVSSDIPTWKKWVFGAWNQLKRVYSDLAASTGSSLIGFLQSGTGAVATDLQTRGRLVVYPQDFGATGDGVTNDRAEFQAAADHAVAIGADLVVPGGTYLIQPAVVITGNGLRIIGAKGAILKKGGTNSIIRLDGDYNEVIGLEFDGNNASYATNACVAVYGANNVVRGNYIHDSGAQGILLDGQATTCRFNLVEGNIVDSCDGVGISQNTAPDNKIAFNTVSSCGLEGITIDVTSHRCQCIGNRVISCCATGGVGGIGWDESDLCTIANNIVTATGSSASGITAQNNAGTTNNSVISGNVLIDNAGYGIDLKYTSAHGAFGIRVTGNIFQNNTLGTINVDSGSINNVLANNEYQGSAPTISNLDSFLLGEPLYHQAYRSSNVANFCGDDTAKTIVFDAVAYAHGRYDSAYDNTTGIWTAPFAGVFEFRAGARITSGSSDVVYAILEFVSSATGSRFIEVNHDAANTNKANLHGSCCFHLSKDDTVSVKLRAKNTGVANTLTLVGDANYTYFTVTPEF